MGVIPVISGALFFCAFHCRLFILTFFHIITLSKNFFVLLFVSCISTYRGYQIWRYPVKAVVVDLQSYIF